MNLKNSKYKLAKDDLSGSWLNNQMPVLLLLTLGGIIIILIWQFFDKYYLINKTRELFWVRFGTILFIL
jgi:hypothetical protein